MIKVRRTALMFAALLALVETPAAAQFSQYEIRVIRPKFMEKAGRVELGAQTTLIMNQSFIYTVMASGILDYHFSEMFALEIGGSYGASIDKEDKRILDDEFDIKTQILRTQYIFQGGLLWTPIYGKTQLTSGRVIYFDSFISLQGGLTGIFYDYEQCSTPPPEVDPNPPSPPAPTTKSYPTAIIGFGQKYFLSETFGLRWDVRDYIFSYDKGDGTCRPEESQGSDIHQNVTLQLGASTFF